MLEIDEKLKKSEFLSLFTNYEEKDCIFLLFSLDVMTIIGFFFREFFKKHILFALGITNVVLIGTFFSTIILFQINIHPSLDYLLYI